MNYQTVNSTKEGRDGLIGNLSILSSLLLAVQAILWIIQYDEGGQLVSWQGVCLAALAGVWITLTALYFLLKRGQGTETTADFGRGVIAIKQGDFWGVFAAERKELILKFEFTSIRVVRRDRYDKPTYLELTDKSGLVSLYSIVEWRVEIPPLFSQIILHGDNLCGVQGPDGRWGVWSRKLGRIVMPAEHPYYKVWDRCHDFAGVPDKFTEGMKWAIFSFGDQRVVTRYISDNIDYLGNGVFRLQDGRRKRRSENRHLRFGLYLHQPRVVFKSRLTSVKEFRPGLVELQDGLLRGLISTKTGQLVVPVECWSMKWVSNNQLELHRKAGTQVVDLANLQMA
jgi:hypothetical protein